MKNKRKNNKDEEYLQSLLLRYIRIHGVEISKIVILADDHLPQMYKVIYLEGTNVEKQISVNTKKNYIKCKMISEIEKDF